MRPDGSLVADLLVASTQNRPAITNVAASATNGARRRREGTATTCEDPDDTAAYWTPTLSVDGVPVDPTFLRAYYRARPGVERGQVGPLEDAWYAPTRERGR